MNVKGRAKFEIVVVVIVVLLTIVVAVGLYAARSKVYNGKRLQTELSAIRTAVTLYATVNKSFPPDLTVLTKNTYDVGGVDKPYLENVETCANGGLCDPFGKPYTYDSKNGRVNSVTAGYDTW